MAQQAVFVSGASGFVGAAVLRALLARDYRINALARSRQLRVQDPRISVFVGEGDDRELLKRATDGVSAAIHLIGIIGERPAERITFQRVHVEFTRAIVEVCTQQGVGRYVHMSALGAREDGRSEYHRTKAAAERIVEQSPLAWTIIRPGLIHGPDGEFARMLLDWTYGRKAPWWFMPYFGAGPLGLGRKSLVQPVHVDDVARVFVEALTRPAAVCRRYDLGGNQRLTWRGMYRVFSQAVLGKTRATLPIPAWYALLLTRLLPANWLPFDRGQVLMSQEDAVADLGPIERDFGFTPMSFQRSVQRYAASLRENA